MRQDAPHARGAERPLLAWISELHSVPGAGPRLLTALTDARGHVVLLNVESALQLHAEVLLEDEEHQRLLHHLAVARVRLGGSAHAAGGPRPEAGWWQGR